MWEVRLRVPVVQQRIGERPPGVPACPEDP
jgi:hypothetical protein